MWWFLQVGPRTVHEWTKSIGNILFLPLRICFSQPPKSPPIPADCWILALYSRLALTRSALTNRHRTADTATPTATAGKGEGTGGERGSDFSVALRREQGAGAGQKKLKEQRGPDDMELHSFLISSFCPTSTSFPLWYFLSIRPR